MIDRDKLSFAKVLSFRFVCALQSAKAEKQWTLLRKSYPTITKKKKLVDV
ncbi:hypothetical protein GCM10010211_65360 [Streptomyces albospinus]|uniref:Transposase n=1 Tax=Streptomyces albospinus TaxID=285515 RepID=A0ABQ2VIU1_9ACTN|nr:hypothetical protein GCM10010211_65360 [Streptomyces albospinus]